MMKAVLCNGKEIKINIFSEPKIKVSQGLVHIKAIGIYGTDLFIL